MTSRTVLGLDIGGSKTQAVLAEDGNVLGEALAGSANVSSVGTEEAGRQLDIILDRLGTKDIHAVCAGAAGVDTPASVARLRDLLADRLPCAHIRVVHDSQLILAAAGVLDGVALISGTGSVAWGRHGEQHARAGGWGYLLGDEGSGYWVAREAVRRTLVRVDRGAAADRLGQQLAADCGLQRPEQLLDHFYAQVDRRYWAGRARVVFELAGDGDPASIDIVDAAGAALAELAAAVAHRLGSTGPVVMAGGLAVHQPMLQKVVRRELGRQQITDVRVLAVDPVRGAVELAQRLLDCEPSTTATKETR
jgi:N-acetylglucosamine kinase-like BadF-type ATPase